LAEPSEAGNVPIWRDFLESVVLAVVLAAILRLFIIQPFWIPSGSMEPNLLPNDRIIVNMLVYRFHPPQRGDIIVFRYPLDPSRDFVKRLIALPGETVEIRNNNVIINGVRLNEPYLPPRTFEADYGPFTVPQGSYFMMGDNRNNSDDSRVWGTVPKKNIIGKTFVIYWPLGRMQLIR
jgi:signal peptidase I